MNVVGSAPRKRVPSEADGPGVVGWLSDAGVLASLVVQAAYEQASAANAANAKGWLTGGRST